MAYVLSGVVCTACFYGSPALPYPEVHYFDVHREGRVLQGRLTTLTTVHAALFGDVFYVGHEIIQGVLADDPIRTFVLNRELMNRIRAMQGPRCLVGSRQ